jgi:purine catabolism regulator
VDTTLGDVLGLVALGLRQVAGPQDGARTVRWVAVSELLDPTPYLEGGEILLTTGMNLPAADDGELYGYVERISRRGVVALGLGVGLTHESTPQGLVEAADRLGLPLFEVPRPTPFIALTRAVADLVAQSERDAVQRSLEQQRRLTRAAARPDAAPALVRELARQLEGWVLVTDARGEAVLSCPALVGEGVAAVGHEVRRLRARRQHATASIAVESTTIEIYPMGSAGRPRWYLAVGLPAPARQLDRSVLAAGVSLLSLALERGGSSATARRLRREVARLLLQGDLSTARSVQAIVDGGSGLPDEVVVLVGEGEAEPEQVVLDLVEDEPHACYADVQQGQVVALAPVPHADAVVAALTSAGLRVGVSRPVPGAAAGTGLQQARQVLAAARSRGERVARFDELTSRSIDDLVDPDLVRGWAEATMAPLRSYSETSGKVDLVASLRTYLAHHGQWHPAAQELGLHRHTLRHRIRRVEELLGVSLDSPEARMNLWFALRHLPLPANASSTSM